MQHSTDEPVSRLPRLPEHPADPDLAEAFETIRSRGGQLINLHLTLGHSPKIFKARLGLSYALRFDAVTPRKLRELVIMRTAQISGSHYELAQHTPIALACGYTQAQIDQLDDVAAGRSVRRQGARAARLYRSGGRPQRQRRRRGLRRARAVVYARRDRRIDNHCDPLRHHRAVDALAADPARGRRPQRHGRQGVT